MTAAHRLLAALALLGLSVAPVGAQERVYTVEDTHRALDGADPRIDCVIRRESDYQPYAIGALGEQGVAQLLPSWRGGGQWTEFHESFAYTSLPLDLRDPFSPWQSIAYVEWYLQTRGHLQPWSTWWGCQ